MCEESDINTLVLNIINENCFSHCRLCLRVIQQTYVKFQDCVSYSPNSTYQALSELLKQLLGDEICDEIAGVDAVCTDCVDKVIETLQFLENCKNSTKKLFSVFHTLSETVNIEIDTTDRNQSLFIDLSENESRLMFKKNEKNIYHQERQFFTCLECNEYFNDLGDYVIHNTNSHNLLTCTKCLFLTTNESDHHNHLNSDQLYECMHCPQLRCTEESLKQHEMQDHMVYVCRDCGKSYTGLKKLHIHEQKHLTRNVCPKCGKSYTTKEFFAKHVKLCLENLIELHPMRSNAPKSYYCEQCDKGYSTPGGLRVHNRFVHGDAKPHVCKYCKKQFTAPSYLKIHMVRHTGEKNFKCNICGNKFVSKEALLYHTRRHTGEKPYSCNICEEKFVNASARAEHIKFKHVEPTLMCDLCPRRFVTRNFLRLHMKKHHDPGSKLYAARELIPPNMPGQHNMRFKVID